MTQQPSKAYPRLITRLGPDHGFLFLNTGAAAGTERAFAVAYVTEEVYHEPIPFPSRSLAVTADKRKTHKVQGVFLGKMYDEVLHMDFFQVRYETIEEAVSQVEYYLSLPEMYRLTQTSTGGAVTNIDNRVSELTITSNKAREDFENCCRLIDVSNLVKMGTRLSDVAHTLIREVSMKVSPFKPSSRLFNLVRYNSPLGYAFNEQVNSMVTAVTAFDKEVHAPQINHDAFTLALGALTHTIACFSEFVKKWEARNSEFQRFKPNPNSY